MGNIEAYKIAYGLIFVSFLLAVLGIIFLAWVSPLKNDIEQIEKRWLKKKKTEEKKLNKSGDLRHITVRSNTTTENFEKNLRDYINLIKELNIELKHHKAWLFVQAISFVVVGGIFFSTSYGLYLKAIELLNSNVTFDILNTIYAVHYNSLTSFLLQPEKELGDVLKMAVTYWPTVIFSWVGIIDIFAVLAFFSKMVFLPKEKWKQTRLNIEKLLEDTTDLENKLAKIKQQKNDGEWDEENIWWDKPWFRANSVQMKLDKLLYSQE